MSNCTNENCDLKNEIQAIRKSTQYFQKQTSESIDKFKIEMRQVIKESDDRQTKSKNHMEDQLRSELQRGQMIIESKFGSYISDFNKTFRHISSDLGEIKGVLGLKASKEDTMKVRNSILTQVNEKVEKEEKERREMEKNANKINYKIMFMIIGMLSSGFISLLIQFINKVLN